VNVSVFVYETQIATLSITLCASVSEMVQLRSDNAIQVIRFETPQDRYAL